MQTVSTESAGLARILDPISLNLAVRRAFGGLDAGASLLVFGISLLFTLAVGSVWWRYDLLSTWEFMQGVQSDTQAEVSAIVGYADEAGVGLVVGALLGVAFTLLPSMVELIAPRVVHPGVQLALNISVLFDFVTDWPTASGAVQRWGGAPLGVLGELACTLVLTLVLSLLVQVFVIMGLTALIVATMNILGFGRRGGGIPPVQVIDMGRR